MASLFTLDFFSLAAVAPHRRGQIGSELIVDPESGRPPPCPVCRSKGEEVCSRCNGVGRIAAWLFKSERKKWEEGRSPPPPPEEDL